MTLLDCTSQMILLDCTSKMTFLDCTSKMILFHCITLPDLCAQYKIDHGVGDLTSLTSSTFTKCVAAMLAHATADLYVYGTLRILLNFTEFY